MSVTDPFVNAIGAYVSAGKYYEFGRSVRAGVTALREYYDYLAPKCPDTRWVIAGYSQGAMVAAQGVTSFLAKKVAYVALFADPQVNLPEGAGAFPDACKGRNLASYRVYVPECRTHKGSLGARNPYQYGELAGKYGLWCGRDDYICGSTNIPWVMSGHTKYVSRMTQLTGILKKRLARSATTGKANVNTAVLTTSTEESRDVVALLPLDKYYAQVGENISFNGANSFSYNTAIMKYEWSFDDEEYWSSARSSTIERSFAAVGQHTLKLRVTDALGESGETQVEIVVVADEAIVSVLSAPVGVVAQKENNEVVLNWTNALSVPESAQYLVLRLNGFDLGYSEINQGELRVSDLDFSDELVLSVAWATADMEIGEFNELEILDNSGGDAGDGEDGGGGDEDANEDSPETGVTFALGALPCLLSIICAMVLWRKWRA